MKLKNRLVFLIISSLYFVNSFKFHQKQDLNSEPIEVDDMCLKRPHYERPEAFFFLPALRAKFFTVGQKFSFPSRCYKKNIATFTEIGKDYIKFQIESKEKIETYCSEIFFFHTSRVNVFQLAAFEGKHEMILKRLIKDDFDEIKVNGIKLFNFCSSLSKTIRSLLTTLKMFYGGLGSDPNEKNPRYRGYIYKDQERECLHYLDVTANYQFERRNNTVVKFDKHIIGDGDFLAINRMDGLEPMIMAHAGPPIAHSAVCVWHDDELWVVESNSGSWPKDKDGIYETPWEEWIQLARNFDFNVVLLPLREEYRKKFNGTKAHKWFKDEIEGLPWGTRNFLFAHIDTTTDFTPVWEYAEMIELIVSTVSYFSKSYADLIMGEALNKRLNTTDFTIQQIIAEAARRGKSFEELIAEPEKEGIVYSDGYNYVCSAFVVAFWEHGGLFGDLEILPQEFTPRDIYELDIYDKEFKRPQECIDDNPELPYCQVTGKFVIYDKKRYSTVKPYSHMNERCKSVSPDFIREEGC